MTVRVKIKEYIQQLEAQENQKQPMQRKPIPSIPEMARAARVGRQTIHSFIDREKHKRLDLDILNAIITQLRQYGHDTQLTDVLVYDPD